MPGHIRDLRGASDHRIDRVLIAVCASTAMIGVGTVAPHALPAVLLDGVCALMIVAPAVLGGLWLVPLTRPPEMPFRWHLLLGAAMGVGTMSLAVLLLGLTGLLHRHVWVALISASAVAGIVRLHLLLSRPEGAEARRQDSAQGVRAGPWRYLWLLACPSLILAILAASNPPGFIWHEEGYGYDVLEYHLQLPKEYVQNGRIPYMPHNVYANFPSGVEMLYLAAMIVFGDIFDIGPVANMIHLQLAMLTVFAAWVAGREWSGRSGVVCGVMMATAGWLSYLCGLAYVENGMLFFGTAATAALLRALQAGSDMWGGTEPADRGPSEHNVRWLLLAGAFTGFACGCKYTALPLLALPLGLVTLLIPGKPLSRRFTRGTAFLGAMLVTFGPWLVKNQVMTGNPVFPLLNTVFQAYPPGWGQSETRQWDLGHRLRAEGPPFPAAMEQLWNHVLADKYQRFGPVLFLLALAGQFGRRRDRTDRVLIAILLAQLALWLLTTHLYARFAVVILIPLSLLCARAVSDGSGRWRPRALLAALAVAGVWNSAFAVALHRQESLPGAPPSLIYDGRTPRDAYFAVVNKELTADSKILLLGDARAFYFQRPVGYFVAFNRNPFFDVVLAGGNEQKPIAWLRLNGYTHVLVNWSEIQRLEVTYGFSPPIRLKELDEALGGLSGAGLKLARRFPHPLGGRYVDLYEVAP